MDSPVKPEIMIFDEIVPDTARSVSERLRANSNQPVVVRINSPGGDLAAGLAIVNAMRQHNNVTVAVEGIAASAATLPCCAGRCRAADNALLMLHAPWITLSGNAQALRATADTLDKFESQIVGLYSAKTGKPTREIKALLEKGDTWLTAQEAQSLGLVDEVGIALPIAAKLGGLAPPARMAALTRRQAPGFGPSKMGSEQIRQLAEAQFYGSATLRAEFREAAIYVAYALAVARGLTRPACPPPFLSNSDFYLNGAHR